MKQNMSRAAQGFAYSLSDFRVDKTELIDYNDNNVSNLCYHRR